MERIRNRDAERRARRVFGVGRDRIEQLPVRPGIDRAEDRADQQGREKTQRHRAQRVEKIGADGQIDLLAFEKRAEATRFFLRIVVVFHEFSSRFFAAGALLCPAFLCD